MAVRETGLVESPHMQQKAKILDLVNLKPRGEKGSTGGFPNCHLMSFSLKVSGWRNLIIFSPLSPYTTTIGLPCLLSILETEERCLEAIVMAHENLRI